MEESKITTTDLLPNRDTAEDFFGIDFTQTLKDVYRNYKEALLSNHNIGTKVQLTVFVNKYSEAIEALDKLGDCLLEEEYADS